MSGMVSVAVQGYFGVTDRGFKSVLLYSTFGASP